MALRVLHIDAGRAWRGGQRQVLLLATGQRERGIEPLVITTPGSPLSVRLRANGVAVSTVAMRGEWDLASAGRIRSLFVAWRPDVVHAHDARGHTLALAAMLGTDVPLVVTRRVVFPPRGKIKYGPRVGRFIAISSAVRDVLVSGGVDGDRIDIVFSGVPSPGAPVARDWRRECDWPSSAVLCGIVGAMTAEKGIDLVGDIVERLDPVARDRVRLVLLGGTGEGRVTIGGVPAMRAGFVDDIHPAMAGLDLLWHPSSAEGLGTTVIDAMWLGVPAVAFAVGGLVEVIEHKRSGVLVPAGNVDAFATEAGALINDAKARQALAGAARERARAFDSWRMIEGTLETYRRVMA